MLYNIIFHIIFCQFPFILLYYIVILWLLRFPTSFLYRETFKHLNNVFKKFFISAYHFGGTANVLEEDTRRCQLRGPSRWRFAHI